MYESDQGERHIGGYSYFWFVLNQLQRRKFKLGIFIVYGYYINVSAGIHGKLIWNGGR